MTGAEEAAKSEGTDSCSGSVCYSCVWNSHGNSTEIAAWPERYPLAFVIALSVVISITISYLPPVFGVELPSLSMSSWTARVVLGVIALTAIFRIRDWISKDARPETIAMRKGQRRPITKLFIVIFIAFPAVFSAIFFIVRLILQLIVSFGIDTLIVDLIESIISPLVGISCLLIFWSRLIDWLMEWRLLNLVVDGIGKTFPGLRLA